MRIESGQGDTSGDVSIRTADSNSDGNGEGNTGALRLKSGAAVVGNSGSVLVGSGQTATGSGGDVTVAVGASGSGALVGATPLSFPLYIFYGWWFLLPSRRNCSFHCFLFSSCSFFTFLLFRVASIRYRLSWVCRHWWRIASASGRRCLGYAGTIRRRLGGAAQRCRVVLERCRAETNGKDSIISETQSAQSNRTSN